MRKMGRRICGGLALLATAASAEDMPQAVGRISYSDVLQPGAAICSGVLVAPGLVLTAGHCVRGAVGDPAVLRFDAGWTDGTPARRRGRAVILATEALSAGLAGLPQDVALVVLDAPFAPDEATPLPIAAAPADDFTLHAFARTAPDQPRPAVLCDLRATIPAVRAPDSGEPDLPGSDLGGPDFPGLGLLGLGCPVVSGNSGAPLLQADGTGWQIAAIMVASGRGPVQAWAARIPEILLTRILQRVAGSNGDVAQPAPTP